MLTTLRKPVLVLGTVLALLVGLAIAYLATPPFFVQLGQHYFGGPDLASAAGFYRCDPPGTDGCVVLKESILAAVANDPNPLNWFPIKLSLVR